LGPGLRVMNFNESPLPINPALMPSANPANIIYAEPRLAPGGEGPKPGPPEIPPAVSTYTGLNGDSVVPGPAPSVPLPPIPGAAGRGRGAELSQVAVADVATLESNSPVMMDDVVVGSVGPMRVKGWHADVEISVKRNVVIPANAVASVGQTSLLGSMHVELNP